MDLSNINYLAVGIAAVAAFGLGALWYSPVLFGKRWQHNLGFTDESLQQGNMGKTYYLYQRRPVGLWAIDAVYQILFLTLMGIIIGAWQ